MDWVTWVWAGVSSANLAAGVVVGALFGKQLRAGLAWVLDKVSSWVK